MRQHREQVHDAGVHTREELEARYGPVFDVRAFARHFILVGIGGQRVAVRRKGGGETGTLRYTRTPLYFFDFVSTSGHNPVPASRGPRA